MLEVWCFPSVVAELKNDMVENLFKDNLRAVIQFLVDVRQAMDIYMWMKFVYGDYSYWP